MLLRSNSIDAASLEAFTALINKRVIYKVQERFDSSKADYIKIVELVDVKEHVFDMKETYS